RPGDPRRQRVPPRRLRRVRPAAHGPPAVRRRVRRADHLAPGRCGGPVRGRRPDVPSHRAVMPIPLVVALTLLREALRALAFPLHAALYWLRRDAAQQRSREILAHWTSAADGEALSDFLAAHPPRRTDRPHVFLSAGEPSGE